MKYTTSRSYGDAWRIWMSFEAATSKVAPVLKSLSIWKGIDKDDGKVISWEFNKQQFIEATEYLNKQGYCWVSSIKAL